MVRVFLSHSSRDKQFVRELAAFLHEPERIKVWLDEAEIQPGDNIVTKIQRGLDAEVVLFIMSPDSIASNWVTEEITDALWEQVNTDKVKLAVVLYCDCQIPRLLRNKKYFDLRTNQLDGRREIKTWLLGLLPASVPLQNLPARPPLFIGRESEIDALRTRLREEGAVVPIQGLPGLGKTRLALEFAHRHKGDFEAVYWLQCVGRDLAALASELAFQLGLKLEGELDKILHDLRAECGRKRCLLVLDNVEDDSAGQLIPGGRASVLVTTRLEHLDFLAFRDQVNPNLFTEPECLDLFRKVLGEQQVAKSEPSAKLIFEKLGYLPVAISVAAALIKNDVRYTVAKPPLLDKLRYGKDNVRQLLTEAIAAPGASERKLLRSMAVCAPEGFRLSLAAEVAELDEEPALDALQELKSRSLVEELDRETRRYRLHTLVRSAAGSADDLHLRHAKAMLQRFEDWEKSWRECEQDLPDFKEAFGWAVEAGEDLGRWRLCTQLVYSGYLLCQRVGRAGEAFALCEQVVIAATDRGDKFALQAGYGSQAGILKIWGRPEEALALLKKQEAICCELGDRGSLAMSYGNQALVLHDCGRQEEALALHNKEEVICLELGDRDGLQASYGNQATILQDWGRLEEALALHKKEEAICEELSDRDGLQVSYGNQALILQTSGRLEEALALLTQKETICQELGNRAQLAYCYWYMADLARARGDQPEARTRAEQSLAIFTELKMRNEIQLVKSLLEAINRSDPPSVA
jgi:tetratricopeptide (TPR) repeat protein